ncbi:MAG: GNAT family N-acetyltransferase [Caulobacteraceae bacterium]
MAHILDKPIWAALTTHQRALDRGDARARAFDARHAYFAAAPDASDESQEALSALIPPGGAIWLLETGAWPAPQGARYGGEPGPVVQMVATRFTPSAPHPQIEPLSDADAAEMTELVRLTEPGPWLERTHQLSPFLGIRRDGRLAAMAGERLHLDGYAEASAVCVHPDCQGQGLGAAMTRAIASRIVARGETPFLHCYAGNTGAIALYERLGFEPRRTMTLTVLTR